MKRQTRTLDGVPVAPLLSSIEISVVAEGQLIQVNGVGGLLVVSILSSHLRKKDSA